MLSNTIKYVPRYVFDSGIGYRFYLIVNKKLHSSHNYIHLTYIAFKMDLKSFVNYEHSVRAEWRSGSVLGP